MNDHYWLYDALGPRIWIHRDNEAHPERPLVFILEADEEQMKGRRRQLRAAATAAGHLSSQLCEIRVRGPSPPSLPQYAGPPIHRAHGRHALELVFDHNGSTRSTTDALTIRN